MRVLITGSNGFIGSHLVEKLLSKGYEVFCLVRKTSNLKWIQHLPVNFIYGDVVDYLSLIPAVENMDYIYHAGGIVRAKSENEFNRVNCEGTKNLLKACRQFNPNIKRFTFISSQAAAGPSFDGSPLKESETPHPISAYGRSKLKAENEVMQYADIFPVTIIRPPSVYGRRDTDVFVIFKTLKFGLKPVVGFGEQKISMIHIDDLVRGICLATEHDKAQNQNFFMADPVNYVWLDVLNLMSRVMGKKAMVIRVPPVFLNAMALLNEKSSRIFNYEAVLNVDKAREMRQRDWLISNEKAEELLSFKPEIELEDGLKETVAWYRNHGWL